jgi:hypothetical protein
MHLVEWQGAVLAVTLAWWADRLSNETLMRGVWTGGGQ